jgi:hypothetical protein
VNGFYSSVANPAALIEDFWNRGSVNVVMPNVFGSADIAASELNVIVL